MARHDWRYTLALGVSLLVTGMACAQGDAGKPRSSEESLQRWQWYTEWTYSGPRGQSPYLELQLPPTVLGRAALTLADLRLRDARGREVPYAVRIRRPETRQQDLAATPLNPATQPDGSVELTLDLGATHGEHNEITLQTTGHNFRRRVRLEGSDELPNWSALVSGSPQNPLELLDFAVEGQTLRRTSFQYPLSRRRYVRVTVFPDPGIARDAPRIERATVSRSIVVPGVYTTAMAQIGPREFIRSRGHPASAWTLTLGPLGVPCSELQLDVADDGFSRPYRLEQMLTPEGGLAPAEMLVQGEWQRRPGTERKPLVLSFNEVRTRQLRLVVIDDRNPPLTLTEVQYRAPVRQVLIADTPELEFPLRLYYDNPNAEAPNYDFAASVPLLVTPEPPRATPVDPETAVRNPSYEPEPLPLTERWPWLVYVVLGVASVVLLGILLVLARQTLERVPPPQTPA